MIRNKYNFLPFIVLKTIKKRIIITNKSLCFSSNFCFMFQVSWTTSTKTWPDQSILIHRVVYLKNSADIFQLKNCVGRNLEGITLYRPMVLISSPTMISKLDVLKDFSKTVVYLINDHKFLILVLIIYF